ncbi:MAG: flavin reductase family protein, partial [Candidatus Lokiarchaeota archaeon]|nr:flavin reductase family protein [Candidatus Lokiarchaeota archaeon]
MNEKKFLEADTSMFPVPPVMVSCCSKDGKKSNIITLAWVGILSSDPPMVGICIRPSRFSYNLIVETGDFVVNIPAESQARAVDYCGMTTGKAKDKFKECGLTAGKSSKVASPLIQECPVNLECKLVKVVKDYSKSHHLFLGEIVAVGVSGGSGKIDIGTVKPLA